MTKEELLKRLDAYYNYGNFEKEKTHEMITNLLLEYLNDEELKRKVAKFYFNEYTNRKF